jgi:hypothetical protein
METDMKQWIVGIALLLMCSSAWAADNPIDQARADCAAHKMKVRALEGRMARSSELAGARKAWERSCAHAQQLMSGGSDSVAARDAREPAHETIYPAPTPPSVTIEVPGACASPSQDAMPGQPGGSCSLVETPTP